MFKKINKTIASLHELQVYLPRVLSVTTYKLFKKLYLDEDNILNDPIFNNSTRTNIEARISSLLIL